MKHKARSKRIKRQKNTTGNNTFQNKIEKYYFFTVDRRWSTCTKRNPEYKSKLMRVLNTTVNNYHRHLRVYFLQMKFNFFLVPINFLLVKINFFLVPINFLLYIFIVPINFLFVQINFLYIYIWCEWIFQIYWIEIWYLFCIE